jgi:alpha-glucosidase
LELIVKHYGSGDEFHLPLNSELISSDLVWHANQIRDIVERYETLLPAQAWPNWSLGNHDKHRVATRLGLDQAKVGMMLLLTLRGTPTIYYGDELGMEDAWIPSEHIQDPWEIHSPGIGVGRDPERSPMLWNKELHAGFCSNNVLPWLPITTEHSTKNVEFQQNDPRSFLSLTRALLALRKHHASCHAGEYMSLYAPGNLFCFRRFCGQEDLLVALNLDAYAHEWMLPKEYRKRSTVLLSTSMDRQGGRLGENLQLRGNEGVILRLLDPP